MDTNLKYIEKQKFRQPWVWIILILTGILVIGDFTYGFYIQIIEGIPWGNNPMSDAVLIINMIIVVTIFIVVYFITGFSKLTMIIDSTGIQYKFFPFQWKFQFISWDNVYKYGVITYSPSKEYGGWGIKFGKNKKAYNIAGDKGLQLYLKSGKKILFGTQKASDLSEFLKKIK